MKRTLKMVLRYAKATTLIFVILVKICLRKLQYDDQFVCVLVIAEQILHKDKKWKLFELK